MPRPACLPLVVATVAAGIATSVRASALGPVDVEVTAKIGWAASPSGNPDPLGVEWGGRVGANVFNFYGGLSVLHSYGGTGSVACVGPVFNVCSQTAVAIAVDSTRYGVEAGYDIHPIAHVTLRPQLGVGNVSFYERSSVEIVVNGSLVSLDGSANDLYLEPGLTAMVFLGPLLLGADASLLWLPGLAGSTAAFSAHGQAGIHF
jgi:hypothetical protein